MRASKEEADRARHHLTAMHSAEGNEAKRKRIEAVLSFVNAAKRKLPTEAAYHRDAKRRRG